MEEKQYYTIKKIMENKDLANDLEKVKLGIKAEMTGYLFSSWLPHGVGRQILMLVIFLISMWGLFNGHYFIFVLFLIQLPFFSPRIIGTVAVFLGKMMKK